jgi:hypothetical protein
MGPAGVAMSSKRKNVGVSSADPAHGVPSGTTTLTLNLMLNRPSMVLARFFMQGTNLQQLARLQRIWRYHDLLEPHHEIDRCQNPKA